MTDIGVGDRVRIEFEGTVVDRSPDGHLWIGRDGSRRKRDNCVPPGDCTVIAPPIKVGDTIEGSEAFEALPVGSVVTGYGHAALKTSTGWVTPTAEYPQTYFYDPRTLVFLPDQS